MVRERIPANLFHRAAPNSSSTNPDFRRAGRNFARNGSPSELLARLPAPPQGVADCQPRQPVPQEGGQGRPLCRDGSLRKTNSDMVHKREKGNRVESRTLFREYSTPCSRKATSPGSPSNSSCASNSNSTTKSQTPLKARKASVFREARRKARARRDDFLEGKGPPLLRNSLPSQD